MSALEARPQAIVQRASADLGANPPDCRAMDGLEMLEALLDLARLPEGLVDRILHLEGVGAQVHLRRVVMQRADRTGIGVDGGKLLRSAIGLRERWRPLAGLSVPGSASGWSVSAEDTVPPGGGRAVWGGRTLTSMGRPSRGQGG